VIHKAMRQYLTLLAYRLADYRIIPLDVAPYAAVMSNDLESLGKELMTAQVAVNLSSLGDAIATFNASAVAMTAAIKTAATEKDVNNIDAKLRDFSRGFVSQGGLPGKEFYKHVVFAPGSDTGFTPVQWSGISEAIEAGNVTLANTWVQKSAKAVEVAARILQP